MQREPHAYVDDTLDDGCYYCGRPIEQHRHAYRPSNLDDDTWPCIDCGRAFTKTPEHFDSAEPVQ